MKIAFFTDDYLPYIHGVTRSMQNYRQALEELGHEVWIVAPQPKQAGFQDDDDHVIRLPSINSYVFDKRPVSLIYPGIAKKLDDYEFDVVHSQTQFYLFVIAGMISKRRNIPHVTTVHTLYAELIEDYPLAVTAGLIAVSIGYPFVFKTKPVLPFASVGEIRQLSLKEKGEIRKRQGWRLLATGANQADSVIAPSAHLKQSLTGHGTTTPITVMSNGINLAQYHGKAARAKSDSKTVDIVCVARLTGEKRQKVIIEAMAYMTYPNARLVLIGDGPDRALLERLADQYGVADRVVFTGAIGSLEVAHKLAEADIFTLPSYRFDNQPMSILEAIASGLPVVYCDDNLREGLADDNALLTDGVEAADFARAFDELSAGKTRRLAMGSVSVQRAQDFDRTELARQLVDHYQALTRVVRQLEEVVN